MPGSVSTSSVGSGSGVGVGGSGVGVGVGGSGVGVGVGGMGVGVGGSGVGVGVFRTPQLLVPWHLEHWPLWWLIGRSPEWQALQLS